MSDTVITVGDRHIREVHREIQAAAEAGGHIVVKDTRSKHNLGVALPANSSIHFEGSVGYYCGGLNNGATITVERNAGWGVGEAMATTLFGLSVGILTLVFYSLSKSRATRTLAEAEQAVHMIADHIKREDKPGAVSALHAGRPPLRD